MFFEQESKTKCIVKLEGGNFRFGVGNSRALSLLSMKHYGYGYGYSHRREAESKTQVLRPCDNPGGLLPGRARGMEGDKLVTPRSKVFGFVQASTVTTKLIRHRY